MHRRCTTRPGHGARPGSSACRAKRSSSEAPVRLRMGDASVDSSEAAAGSCHGSVERRDRPRRRVAIMDTPRTCRQWWKTEIRSSGRKKAGNSGAGVPATEEIVWSCTRPGWRTTGEGSPHPDRASAVLYVGHVGFRVLVQPVLAVGAADARFAAACARRTNRSLPWPCRAAMPRRTSGGASSKRWKPPVGAPPKRPR